MSEETAGLDGEAASRAFQQIVDLYVRPEMDRRLREGKAKAPFEVRGFQVLLGGFSPPLVRLNHEVRAIARIKPSRAIAKGELITSGDIEGVDRFELVGSDDDYAHITAIRLAEGWSWEFRFEYKLQRSREHLTRSQEFLAAALLANESNHPNATVELLYGAVELSARAFVLALPAYGDAAVSSHQYWQGELNRHSRTSWSGLDTKLLDELFRLRKRVRYMELPSELSSEEIAELLQRSQSFVATLNNTLNLLPADLGSWTPPS